MPRTDTLSETEERPTSDEAVLSKTGRGWDQWFAFLDAAGAREMRHRDIAAHLAAQPGVSGWWAQMVAVGYERARGMREKHQTTRGYQASASRTIGAPVERLYQAWADDAERSSWLTDASFTIRKATPPKSLRMTGQDGTALELYFTAKGESRSQVSVEHGKLSDAEAVSAAKAAWKERLGRLKERLEDRA